jgi:hypothetical protein
MVRRSHATAVDVPVVDLTNTGGESISAVASSANASTATENSSTTVLADGRDGALGAIMKMIRPPGADEDGGKDKDDDSDGGNEYDDDSDQFVGDYETVGDDGEDEDNASAYFSSPTK